MMDKTNFKYKIPCIAYISGEQITNLAFNIYGVFYPYEDYDVLCLQLYDHTLGEDLPFNKVGYYYTNSELELRLTSLALDYIKINEDFINPQYQKKYIDELNFEINSLLQDKKLLEESINNLELYIKNLNLPADKNDITDSLFIDIFRISPEGKYLEIDITCDSRYKFKRFNLYDYKTKDSGSYIDLLSLIKEYFKEDDSRILARISLDKLYGNTMYYADIEIELKNDENFEEVVYSNTVFEVATSDISNVYFYLLPGLVQLGHPCDSCDLEIPIEIQRAFIIMWAHIEAMRLERWGEAEMFYTLIKNNFLNCLTEFEVKQKSCNCHALKLSNFNFRR